MPGSDPAIGIDKTRVTPNPAAHFNTALAVGTDPAGTGGTRFVRVRAVLP